jgi:molybdopterin-guanine dinucleotide biosynthesis protein A
MFDQITGVVLAGGKSTRMGRDKATLPFRGRPLIETVVDQLSSIFNRVVMSVNEQTRYRGSSCARVQDFYDEVGPIGGIASTLGVIQEPIFCVACDMPFLNPDLIRFQCSIQDCDAVIPVWRGQVHVLHALYSPRLLENFEACIRKNRFRVADALLPAHVRYLQESEIKAFDPEGASFRNVNTPQQYLEIDPDTL